MKPFALLATAQAVAVSAQRCDSSGMACDNSNWCCPDSMQSGNRDLPVHLQPRLNRDCPGGCWQTRDDCMDRCGQDCPNDCMDRCGRDCPGAYPGDPIANAKGTAGPGTSIEDGKCVVNLGDNTFIDATTDKVQIKCNSDGSPRRLEALEVADAPGPHAEPAGREHVKALLKDHPELVGALLRAGGEDGTVADDVLDKLIQFNQLFGQPALA